MANAFDARLDERAGFHEGLQPEHARAFEVHHEITPGRRTDGDGSGLLAPVQDPSCDAGGLVVLLNEYRTGAHAGTSAAPGGT
jgi:hypothetical protein